MLHPSLTSLVTEATRPVIERLPRPRLICSSTLTMDQLNLAALSMDPASALRHFAMTSPDDSFHSDGLGTELSSPAITEASYQVVSPTETEAPQKRKRGRPRKHPLVPVQKPKNGRSRTGCITCRKRKKKCDETKPACEAHVYRPAV